jgi:hypothetical protein
VPPTASPTVRVIAAVPSPTLALLPTLTIQPDGPLSSTQGGPGSAFWYLLGGGALVATTLLVHGLHQLAARRR